MEKEKEKLVFLCSPYSSISKDTRTRRYYQALGATIALISKGINVFSPIVYGHSIVQNTEKLGTDDNYWKGINNSILKASDLLLLLEIEGWMDSTGVKKERALAREENTPELFIKPNEIIEEKRLDAFIKKINSILKEV